MAQGFICEAASVANITTPPALAQVITLGANTARDAFAVANPSGGYWSHIDVVGVITAGSVTGATFVLTWDAAGDNVACLIPAGQVTAVPALTTASTVLITANIDKWPRCPSGYQGGTVYVFMAVVGGGTLTVNKMRLHWRDGQSGG